MLLFNLVVRHKWFSPDTPVSSSNKTDHHDITEILLKVALNTINQFKPHIWQHKHVDIPSNIGMDLDRSLDYLIYICNSNG